jgi:3-hydroxyisobutyrate dehydrogenase
VTAQTGRMTPIRRIGFVGLGNMGAPMARNLARAGFDVRVRDADPDRQELLASELGPEAAAFEAPDAVITMLPTGDDVRAVLLDDDGEVAAALRPGTVAIDMSSSAPVGTRQLGAALGERARCSTRWASGCCGPAAWARGTPRRR